MTDPSEDGGIARSAVATASRGVRRGGGRPLRLPSAAATRPHTPGWCARWPSRPSSTGGCAATRRSRPSGSRRWCEHHATSDDPPALVALLHRPGEAFTRLLARDLPDVTDPRLRRPRRLRADRVAGGRRPGRHRGGGGALRSHPLHRRRPPPGRGRDSRSGGWPGSLRMSACSVWSTRMDGLRLSAFHRRVAGPLASADVLALLAPWARGPGRTPRPRHRRSDRSGRTSGVAGSTSGVGGRGRRPSPVSTSRSCSDGSSNPCSGSISGAVAPRRDRACPDVRRRAHPRCDADGGALFTLAPPRLEALTLLADAGEVMPPKTTYFKPKPCTGIFLRP